MSMLRMFVVDYLLVCNQGVFFQENELALKAMLIKPYELDHKSYLF